MQEDSHKEPLKKRRRSLFPKGLGQSLEVFLKPIYKKHGFAEHRILTEWAAIAGADVAAYSVPQKISFAQGRGGSGTLYVEVSGNRAFEMQYRLPEMIDRINTYCGYRAVDSIKFLPSSAPPAAVKTTIPSRNKTGSDSASNAAFAALAQTCDDEALRAALVSLGNALATVEK